MSSQRRFDRKHPYVWKVLESDVGSRTLTTRCYVRAHQLPSAKDLRAHLLACHLEQLGQDLVRVGNAHA